MPLHLHPLLLPEILGRISIYVPAWTPYHHSDNRISYYYHPQDLVACSLVSRTWYHIFYHQLWTVFDGEAMSGKLAHGNDRDANKTPVVVPEELLMAHSPRFLIFTNYNGRIGGIFQCRQLIDLTLHRACPRALHLVRMNPGLKRLTWYGAIPYSGQLSDLESYALSCLDQLKELTLEQWDVSKGRLLQTLRKNSNSLVKLTLRRIQGLDILTEEMDEHIEDRTTGKTSDDDAEKKGQGLVLGQLVELTVDCEWAENRALLDLITRCCPNIERLQLSDELVSDTWMMSQLEPALAETHPMLKRVDSTFNPRRYSWGVQYQSVAGHQYSEATALSK
ncbi:hypothetical protein EDD21DRAFT_422967 [Dissophora ornata]|nr:hypothetical protein EDD21DRAFT_422967 [Dissophora ornata]